MPANVESLFYVYDGTENSVPWHGLGTRIESAPTSEDAIVAAGLDWNVIQESVFTSDGILIPGYKANIRDTDRKVLGMVTNKYKIVQNKEAFSFTNSLLGEGVRYETAGSLATGRRVWMLARLDDRKITDEKISPYLVFTNCHDGTGAVRVAITPVRVVCQNTLNLALSTAERSWSCAHMGNIESKLEEAKKTLLNTETYLANLEEEFGELKMHKLTDKEVVEYIKLLIPVDDDANDRKKQSIKELRCDLMDRYLYTPNLQPLEKSAYRFVNAVSDFATHREPARRTANYQENLFMITIDGNALIDMSYRLVKAA